MGLVRGKGFLDNGVSKGNLIGQVKRSGCEGIVRASVSEAVSQQQPSQGASVSGVVSQQQTSQGASVCWERFLNVRTLRVLLVENDDSTRHVVSALLRNCSYEVIEASNGVQAWKILEDIMAPVNLVLTEVIMPFLSGIGLLCKIMRHKTRKNVPVIMMSSHDSMGLVFKCLSKGAVDFLVKPIRKNELKNLWQHVWRRCHSSSGSGSESGTQTLKYMKCKSADKSVNSSSNCEEDNQSPPLNFGDGSDHGSGTQSSWTKQAVEDQVESSHQVSLVNEIAECPDSTCAQVIHPNVVPSVDKFVNAAATKDCIVQKESLGLLENAEIDNVLHISARKNSDLQHKVAVEIPAELTSVNQKTAPKIGANEANDGNMTSRENLCPMLHCRDGNVVGMVQDCTEPTLGSKHSSRPSAFSKISETNKSKELPFVEKSLKRARGVQEVGKTVQDDRNVLRRSQFSAFSRYNATLHNRTSDPKSSCHLENGLDGELMHNIQSQSGSNAPANCSNGRSFYINMTSSSNDGFSEALALRTMSRGTPSAKDSLLSPDQKCMLENVDGLAVARTSIQYRSIHQDPKTQIHHQPPNCSMQPQPFPGPHSVSPDVAPVESNAGNSFNGSASGSNHGSNGQNGCSTAANVGLYNESDNGGGGKNGSGDASGTGSGDRLDHGKHAQREAALTKFRQKRKERCFKRKVRYQRRKKLAEQRPRVRGQFVSKDGSN